MTRIHRRIYAALLGTALGMSFVTVFAPPASAANLYWKNGTAVSHSTVFSGSNSSNIQCWAPAGYSTTMCIRFDRRTIYVRSDKANGYFKLGQWTGSGNIYRCQNNRANSSGNGTWVACQWNWPKSGCYTMRTGYGQHDWYVLSHASGIKCY